MKSFKIMGINRKPSFYGGRRVHEKPIYRGELRKKGVLGQFADLRGAWLKRGGIVDIPMHTMIIAPDFLSSIAEAVCR